MKKLFIFSMCAVVVSMFQSVNVMAADMPDAGLTECQYKDADVEPQADTIIYKFRDYNGRTQYRRWNDTKKCWVDPHWIDV